MSKFLSGDHIDTDDSIGIYIKVLTDEEEFIPTFFLSLPERDIDIEEFECLIAGLNEAKYKIQQLIEIFENGIDS
jgi:hypothetical protein